MKTVYVTINYMEMYIYEDGATGVCGSQQFLQAVRKLLITIISSTKTY